MTPEQTQAEVEFLVKTFGEGQPAHLLDVPCGNGRHSIGLAKRGYRVTGVDASEEFIAEAQKASQSLPASWVLSDMRELPWAQEFSGAFCFGNSFGYLNAREARKFLVAVARALKPGSRFVLESGMAAESILPTLQQVRWYKVGDIYMLSSNEYNVQESRLDIQYTFIHNGQVDSRPSSSYVLTVNEICRIHSEAGLEPTALLSSISGEPYALGSGRLIMISTKQ